MVNWNTIQNRAQPGLLLALVILLAGVYMLTYSARPESGDSVQLFDAASSWARFGDLQLDETVYFVPPQLLSPNDRYPTIEYDTNEPLAVFVVAIFYRVADALPGLGLAHTAWLSNIIVIAMTGAVLFAYARALGYRPLIATVGTLMFGIGTSLWPYSKTLFREPLVMLFLLTSALLLELWRRWGYLRAGWLLPFAILVFAAAFATKNSALMALPALVLIPLPSFCIDRRLIYILDSLLIAGLALLVVMAFVPAINSLIFQFLRSTLAIGGINRTLVQTALHTYLFSIGGSLWGTSPLLLMAVPGAVLLMRDNKRRMVWMIVAIVAGYAMGHAMLTGVHWFGGVSWPPRFLVPLVPFVMLAVLPVVAWLFQERRRRIWWFLAGGVVIYSISIQVIATISFLGAYGGLLPAEAGGLLEWSPGLNSIAYLRWILLPQSWASVGFDIAWVRADSPHWMIIYTALILASLWIITLRLRGRGPAWFALMLAIGFVSITFLGLQALYANDPFFWANKSQLFELLQLLEKEAEDAQPLILEGSADVTYDEFVMNYNGLDTIRPLIFGFQPGEAVSPQEPPLITSDYVPALLELYVPRAIDHLAQHHERIWFLAHNSLFLPWSVRPIERYLAEFYYPLREVTTDDPAVRLLEFSSIRAPERYNLRLPEHSTSLTFGNAIRLSGFTMPQGLQYQPGEVVPITFAWETQKAVSVDYVVAWFIVKDDRAIPPIQGMDSMPTANFNPTTSWQPHELIWDNHALVLPETVPAGNYDIWLVLYAAGSGGTQRLMVRGDRVLEDTIGVLPISITISPAD